MMHRDKMHRDKFDNRFATSWWKASLVTKTKWLLTSLGYWGERELSTELSSLGRLTLNRLELLLLMFSGVKVKL